MNVATAIVETAELRLRQPVAFLREFLGCFWSMTVRHSARIRAFPDGCTTISIESSIEPKCFFAGPRLTPWKGAPGAGQTLIGVRLRPGVAFALTGMPVRRFVDRRTRLRRFCRPMATN